MFLLSGADAQSTNTFSSHPNSLSTNYFLPLYDTAWRSLLVILILSLPDISSFTMWHKILFGKWQTIYSDEFWEWLRRREGCKQLSLWLLNCLKVVCKNGLACKKRVPVVLLDQYWNYILITTILNLQNFEAWTLGFENYSFGNWKFNKKSIHQFNFCRSCQVYNGAFQFSSIAWKKL